LGARADVCPAVAEDWYSGRMWQNAPGCLTATGLKPERPAARSPRAQAARVGRRCQPRARPEATRPKQARTRVPTVWCKALRSDAARLGDGEHGVHIARVALQRLHHLRGRVVVRDVQPQACPRARCPGEPHRLRMSTRSAAAPDHSAPQLVGAQPRRFHPALRQDSASARGWARRQRVPHGTRAAKRKLTSAPS